MNINSNNAKEDQSSLTLTGHSGASASFTNISICYKCYCMTHTLKLKSKTVCGKCGADKK